MNKLFFVSMMLALNTGFMSRNHLNHQCSDEKACNELSKKYISYANKYIESHLIFIDCGEECKKNKKAEILIHTLKSLKKSINKRNKPKFYCDTMRFNAMLKESTSFVTQNNNIDIKHKRSLYEINPINQTIFMYDKEKINLKSEV
jgi:hypothetical protein